MERSKSNFDEISANKQIKVILFANWPTCNILQYFSTSSPNHLNEFPPFIPRDLCSKSLSTILIALNKIFLIFLTYLDAIFLWCIPASMNLREKRSDLFQFSWGEAEFHLSSSLRLKYKHKKEVFMLDGKSQTNVIAQEHHLFNLIFSLFFPLIQAGLIQHLDSSASFTFTCPLP